MGNLLNRVIFNKTSIPTLSKLADLSALRQKLVASNIANVNTPGYERKQIDFDGELKRAIDKPKIGSQLTHPQHIPLGNSKEKAPEIKSFSNAENSTGVNAVDIEQEMADLAQNQLIFQFGSKMLGKKFRGLKSAIRGKA